MPATVKTPAVEVISRTSPVRKTAPRHRMFPYQLHVRQPTACNDDKVCHADHVDISGIRATAAHETVCATFQEK